MIRGAAAIVWKEWRELLTQPGSLMVTGWRSDLLTVLGVGIYVGYAYDETVWGFAGVPIIFGAMITLMHATDTFAGERERQTLQTLLTTRLPDRAIFIGKVGATGLYGFVAVVLCQATLLVTIGVRGAEEPVGFVAGAATLAVGTLVVWLVATIGVIISLRSRTVKEAQQTTFTGVIALFGAPLLLLLLAAVVVRRVDEVPEWVVLAVERVAGVEPAVGVLLGIGTLLVLNFAFLAIGMVGLGREGMLSAGDREI